MNEEHKREAEQLIQEELRNLEKRGIIMRDPFDPDVFIVLEHEKVMNWREIDT